MIRSLEEAIKDQPEGEYCGFCGKKNDWWDDVGFFYCYNSDDKYVASCGCVRVNTAER